MTRFVLSMNHGFVIGESLPVFLDGKEIIGSAITRGIKPTGVWNREETVITPHEEVVFELEEFLRDKDKYSVYFNGSNNRLCVQDMVKRRERERAQEKRQIQMISSIDTPYTYVCQSCSNLIKSSKTLKIKSCKICSKGKLKRV